ncbi:MAG TPA: hypothetical protein VHH36_09015 [Candidatus Thermoplasmatota archaeon]|nr:hypothetical protein [Candidatus Thermoplasmatota archaeon]
MSLVKTVDPKTGKAADPSPAPADPHAPFAAELQRLDDVFMVTVKGFQDRVAALESDLAAARKAAEEAETARAAAAAELAEARSKLAILAELKQKLAGL